MARSRLRTTVREDTHGEHTIIFRDETGTEVGSVVATLVPFGVRLDVWNGNDTYAGQISARAPGEGGT